VRDNSNAILIDQGELLAEFCLYGLRGNSCGVDDVDESALIGQQVGVNPDVLLLLWDDWLMQNGFLSWVLDAGALVGRSQIEHCLSD
jgi:hypothetical protein